MRPVLQRGVRTLSWTRVVPRASRHARCVQIRATPSVEPTVNGDHLPLANTPSSAESRGMLLHRDFQYNLFDHALMNRTRCPV